MGGVWFLADMLAAAGQLRAKLWAGAWTFVISLSAALALTGVFGVWGAAWALLITGVIGSAVVALSLRRVVSGFIPWPTVARAALATGLVVLIGRVSDPFFEMPSALLGIVAAGAGYCLGVAVLGEREKRHRASSARHTGSFEHRTGLDRGIHARPVRRHAEQRDMRDASGTERATGPSSAPALRVSVVVPVYNRSGELRRLLHALVGQTFPRPWIEVLVCDDGSTEDLAEVLAEFDDKLMLFHLRQANLGPGAARNLGLMHARGELVALTDSDCIPASTWLDEIIRPLADESVGIVGGDIDYVRAEHLSGQCINFLMSSTLGAAGARNPRSAVHMKYYPRTGNLAVRRELALAAGGFPVASHGEDLEFSHKVMQLGGRAAFAERAQVIHNERRGLWGVAREAFKKGKARVRLATRHGIHEVIHGLPALLCAYLAFLSCAAAWRWELLAWLAIPGCLYAVTLGALAIQGAIALRSARAGPLVAVYAVAMHLGYGLGYLCAGFGHALEFVSRVGESRCQKLLRPHEDATDMGVER